MRILTVASPHAVATRDVFFGHLKGLRKVLGEENVQSYDIIKRFNVFTHFTEWLNESIGIEVPKSMASNMLAAEPVFGAAHAWGGVIGERADVIYLVSPMYFPMTVVEMLKAAGFQVWAFFTECPYEDEFWSRAQAPLMDVCFVSDRQSVERFKMFNERTYYLPHAYDPDLHYPRTSNGAKASTNGIPEAADPPNDHEHVTFVGTGFPSRQKFLEETDWSDVDLRLYGNWWQVGEGSPDGRLRSKATGKFVTTAYADENPDEVDVRSPIADYVRRRLVENVTTAQIYRGSKIGISMHRTERFYRTGGVIDKNEAYSIGPRAFELAACGLFQLSDPRPELVDVFGEGNVPMFETPEELGHLVRYYLDHDDEREALARQNLEAVQGHTFEARARQMLNLAA